MSAAEVLAQSAWQTYTATVGHALPPGLAVDLAQDQLDALKAAGYVLIERPSVLPFGLPVTSAAAIKQVWDAFVAPSQSDDAPPQSVEMRVLMAVLRSVAAGLEAPQ